MKNNEVNMKTNEEMDELNRQTIAENRINSLRSTKEVPLPFSTVFAKYPFFNKIQSVLYPHLIDSDDNLVVSSPTGSGKTILFEMAMVNILNKNRTLEKFPYIMVYVAPMKALCEERLQDWQYKFLPLGIKCISVTGDSDELDCDTSFLSTFHVIITTPEKWDRISRRYKENKMFISLVKLFMIDEIHLLNDDTRGATLEAIVSRMKMVQNYSNTSTPIRFLALSATIPNIEDISEWIGTKTKPAKFFKFGEDMRPVKLKKVVLGYPYNPQMSSPFKFDIMLSYKLQNIIMQYSDGKPTLIFCSTRKSTEMTAKQVVQQLTINLSYDQKKILEQTASRVYDKNLKEVVIHGVGMHHAGITREDREILQSTFRDGHLPVLITTSTLAMGVNLPAHLVIVKSTKYYAKGEYKDHSESTILQMIGRAGRPQFDTTATAVIMTTAGDKSKYENMVGGTQPVESSLHKNLIEHLNAEVVLHTITDLSLAINWLASTFLYIRARKNPKYYGLPYGLDSKQLDNKLLELCQIEINKLAREGMLTLDENVAIKPSRNGYLMAKYCVHFETLKLFRELTGKEILQQILSLVSKSHEYSEMYLRVNDKKTLNLLNHCRDKETIRFPLTGKIKTLEMKINCLIQAVFGSLPIIESSLITEAQKIIKTGERITICLIEYLENMPNCFTALLSTVTLNKCFRAQLWENSIYVSKQLPRIGTILSKNLSDSGRKTFDDILKANPRDLERILNKKAPFGNDLQDLIKHLPKYLLELKLIQENGCKTVYLSVTLLNVHDLTEKMTVDKNSYMFLIVGDDDNNILHYAKYKHYYLQENPELAISMQLHDDKIAEIRAHLVSEDWVGIDCRKELVVGIKKDNVKMLNDIPLSERELTKPDLNAINNHQKCKINNGQPTAAQKFMDMYFKNKKPLQNVKLTKTKPKKTIQRTISQLLKDNVKKASDKSAQSFFGKLENNMLQKHGNNDNTSDGNLITNNTDNKDVDPKLLNTKTTLNDSDNSSNVDAFLTKILSSPKGKALSECVCTNPPILNRTEEVKTPNESSTTVHSTTVATTTDNNHQSEMETLLFAKTITWKSPLASYRDIAPKPMVPSLEVNDCLKDVIQNTKSQVPTLSSTIKRINSDSFKNNFPLTDEQCDDASADTTTKIDDIVSFKLLEELGFNAIADSTGKSEAEPVAASATSNNNKVVKQKFQDTAEYFSLLQPKDKLAELQNAVKIMEKIHKEKQDSLITKADTTTHQQSDDSCKSLSSDVSFDIFLNRDDSVARNALKNPNNSVNSTNKRNYCCSTAVSSKANPDETAPVIKKNKFDPINIKLDCLSGRRSINIAQQQPNVLPIVEKQRHRETNPFAPLISGQNNSCQSQQNSQFQNPGFSIGEFQQKTDAFTGQPKTQKENTCFSFTNATNAKQGFAFDNQQISFGFNDSFHSGLIQGNSKQQLLSQSLFDEDEEIDMNQINDSIFNCVPSQCECPETTKYKFSGTQCIGNVCFKRKEPINSGPHNIMVPDDNKHLFGQRKMQNPSYGVDTGTCYGFGNATGVPFYVNPRMPLANNSNTLMDIGNRGGPTCSECRCGRPTYGNFIDNQRPTTSRMTFHDSLEPTVTGHGLFPVDHSQFSHNCCPNNGRGRFVGTNNNPRNSTPATFPSWFAMQNGTNFPFNNQG